MKIRSLYGEANLDTMQLNKGFRIDHEVLVMNLYSNNLLALTNRVIWCGSGYHWTVKVLLLYSAHHSRHQI